jgi:hypothetical protein
MVFCAGELAARDTATTPTAVAKRSLATNADEVVELALRHQHAEGVPRDLDRALTLFCEASALGSAKAAYQLAIARLYGRGVERSDGKAVYWLTLAETREHSHAPRLLARLRAPVEPDQALCRTRAVGSGSTGGTERLAVPAEITSLVSDLAPSFQLDPRLVTAIIAVESGFRVDAVSPKKAQGLMQLIPATAARFGVANAFDPAQNLRGGMMYLRFLLDRFDGDVTLALAAYNAGEGAVDHYAGVPPYDETRRYLERMRRYYDRRYHPVGASRR